MSLNSTNTTDQLFISLNSSVQLNLSPNESLQIHTSIPSLLLTISSILFQFQSPISLQLSPDNTFLDFVQSESSGFIQRLNSTDENISCFLRNPQNSTADLLFSVLGLTESDPLPGGCAIDTPLSVVPQISIQKRDKQDFVKVRFPPAGGPHFRDGNIFTEDMNCEGKRKFYEKELFYDVYASYGADLDQFLTVQNLDLNGRKMCTVPYLESSRISFAALPWRRFVLNVVVRNKSSGARAAYVPLQKTVEGLEDLQAWAYFAFVPVFLFGMVMAVAGHQLFALTQFLTGFVYGAIIGCALLIEQKFIVYAPCCFIIGLLTGCLFYILWREFGNHLLCVVFVSVLSGFVVGAVLSYFWLDSWTFLGRSSASHSLVFFAPVLLTATLLIFWMKTASIVSTSLVGASFAITILSLLIDKVLGGDATLHYIFIRAIQRFAYNYYGEACFLATFYETDTILTCVWAVILLCSLSIQCFVSKHQSLPFPRSPKPIIKPKIMKIFNKIAGRTPLIEQNQQQGVTNPSLSVNDED